MKQLFFTGSFAALLFFAYGAKTGTHESSVSSSMLSIQTVNDTIPGRDTSKKKKYWGKDSTMKKDSTRPPRDTTHQ